MSQRDAFFVNTMFSFSSQCWQFICGFSHPFTSNSYHGVSYRYLVHVCLLWWHLNAFHLLPAIWVVYWGEHKKPCIRWGPDAPCEGAILRGEMRGPLESIGTLCPELCKNGWTDRDAASVWTCVGPRKHVLDGVQIGATWRIPLNSPCAAAMRPYVKLLWPPLFMH